MSKALRLLATAFRQAIEVSDLRTDIAFREFPRGACGDASLLLSEFLRRHGFDDIDYVVGLVRNGPEHQSHAWLEIGATIIDITADQFASRPGPPVLVTRERTWHAHFIEEERRS